MTSEKPSRRAAIQFHRNSLKDDWTRVGVWFATPGMLMSRFLPDSGMGDFVRSIHQMAHVRPYADGTPADWTDFIGYALDALSNGYDLMIGEVSPESSVDRQYGRDILGLTGKALDKVGLQGIPGVTAIDVPDELGPAARV